MSAQGSVPAPSKPSGQDKSSSTGEIGVKKANTGTAKATTATPSLDLIAPGLYLGNLAAATSQEALKAHNISALVSLSHKKRDYTNTRAAGIPSPRQFWLSVRDNQDADLLMHFPQLYEFIESVAPPRLNALRSLDIETLWTSENDEEEGAVLIHCVMGRSRSPTVLAGYLMRKLELGVEVVLKHIRRRRQVCPNLNFMEQLWWEEQRVMWDKANKDGRTEEKTMIEKAMDDKTEEKKAMEDVLKRETDENTLRIIVVFPIWANAI
ncbi:protein-tyrosine phosphatase-like protein [Aspergillus californicus]